MSNKGRTVLSIALFLYQLAMLSWLTVPAMAQEESKGESNNGERKAMAERRATLTQESEGTRTIILDARNEIPEPPVFFTAIAQADARVELERVEQVIVLDIKVLQGKAETLSFGLNGDGEVVKVQEEHLRSWSVRRQGNERFLDLHLNEGVLKLKPEITLRSPKFKLPTTLDLTHLAPGQAVGFDSTLRISFEPGVEGKVSIAEGFAPLKTSDGANRFQTVTGGQLQLSLDRNGALPAAVELFDTTLVGIAHSNGDSIHFQLRGQVHVNEPNSEVTILYGSAAVSQIPTDANFRLRLDIHNDSPQYKLVFAETGTFPVSLDFVVPLRKSDDNTYSVDFTVAA
ncbi:MAG: hypothetical protein ABI557_21105, partial [Aureliella sp.]